jgi:putative ABC transport system permease protein
MSDLLAAFLRDIRFGVRVLFRSPVLTGSVIAVLAIGLGANSAMFSMVDALLLHPVPYPDPESLVFIWSHDSQGAISDASAADFMDWRAQSKTLSDIAAWMPITFVLTGGDRARQVVGARVSANFFRTLRVNPALGRFFLPDEDGLDNPAAAAQSAVISYRLWQQDLGADPKVLGRTIYVDTVPYKIIGVAPPDFQFRWKPHDIWVPVALNTHERDVRDLAVIARLHASRGRAAAEMDVIARSLEKSYPESDKGWTIRVEDFQEFLLNHTFRARLLVLSVAVGLILLIACANIASLLLARAAVREREIAVRISVGATRGHLFRQLLTESALLSVAGGTLGLAIAWVMIRLAPNIVPANALPGGSISLNATVIWFTLGISLLSCLLFGLAPAVAVARSDVQAALKDFGRGSTPGRKSQGVRQALIVADAAIAMMLLAGAGLMIASLRDLTQKSPGFDPKNVVAVRLVLPEAKYSAERSLEFYREGTRRIAALPGVKSVAVATSLPLLNNWEVRFKEEGSAARGDAELPSAAYAGVGPDYFLTMGIPLKQGRFFTEADDEKAPLVAIVSEALAVRYFPNQDPIGKRLTMKRPIRFQNGEEPVTLQVVGVAGNVKLNDPSIDDKPVIYVPHKQNPWSRGVWFAARTEANPAGLGSALRAEFQAIDREQPIDQLGTLEQRLQNQSAEPRFQTGLMSSFALVALFLAALGIYGVNAYAVAQRRGEIGLRMALGASRGAVLRQVIARGMGPTVIGIVIGVAGAAAISAWLKSVVASNRPTDPLAYLGAALILAAVAALACLFPGLKATRIDPAITLRTE